MNELYTDLSDFIRKSQYIKRTGEIAEIVVAYDQTDQRKPVRLIGFTCPSDLTNFEILERGYDYYCRLADILRK